MGRKPRKGACDGSEEKLMILSYKTEAVCMSGREMLNVNG